MGKTQLAVEYAWKHLADYHSVLWVKADSPEALDADLAALTTLLKLPEANEREQAIQRKGVLRWLNEHEHWLVVADNADTDDAANAVSSRFAPNLRGHVLITSRISGWPVNIQDLALDILLPDAATHYLLDRVTKRGHDAGDETAAGKLAEELGYLPLALEQAAAFIMEVRWSFAKYQEQIRELRPHILNDHREGGTHYPASVAKTWSITLGRLSSLSRALLCLAAWFAPEAIPRDLFLADKAVLFESATSQNFENSFEWAL